MRHTYATMSLAAGVSLFSLSRRIGTSLDMIDRTYGHLAPDAEAVELALLNAYDTKTETFGADWPLKAATRLSRFLLNALLIA
jgi:hypothetical protein